MEQCEYAVQYTIANGSKEYVAQLANDLQNLEYAVAVYIFPLLFFIGIAGEEEEERITSDSLR